MTARDGAPFAFGLAIGLVLGLAASLTIAMAVDMNAAPGPERLGLYDRTTLHMDAPVFDSAADMAKHHGGLRGHEKTP